MTSLTHLGLVVLAFSPGIHALPATQAKPAQTAPRTDTRALDEAGVMHLVDCHPLETATNSTQTWMSLVLYCANSADCNSVAHFPEARDICVMKTSNSSLDYHKWENSDWQHCYFAERGVFSWALSRFARLFPPATEVGRYLLEKVDNTPLWKCDARMLLQKVITNPIPSRVSVLALSASNGRQFLVDERLVLPETAQVAVDCQGLGGHESATSCYFTFSLPGYSILKCLNAYISEGDSMGSESSDSERLDDRRLSWDMSLMFGGVGSSL
ncbi:predicted protein [Chaetomium globosum CBS 148.51]|uniref:Apple domain-containing protein n=1 Tax=Chaetomium globosum (strain ATCC 6205 / CBS 148.51 / DSM 1962 / NBRC 6347 / NRRL 1970) TaxID=306901 RepID=Q2GTU6_CHAGB|nr:uncharacterized protein CHGG_08608 [Chaetomium globosum CBS 148.51]EAQ84594.1 predicted protein [Chaetomium globosum CBS 148.51]